MPCSTRSSEHVGREGTSHTWLHDALLHASEHVRREGTSHTWLHDALPHVSMWNSVYNENLPGKLDEHLQQVVTHPLKKRREPAHTCRRSPSSNQPHDACHFWAREEPKGILHEEYHRQQTQPCTRPRKGNTVKMSKKGIIELTHKGVPELLLLRVHFFLFFFFLPNMFFLASRTLSRSVAHATTHRWRSDIGSELMLLASFTSLLLLLLEEEELDRRLLHAVPRPRRAEGAPAAA